MLAFIIVSDDETTEIKEPAKGMEGPYMVPFTAAAEMAP